MNKYYSFANTTETSADLYIYGDITSYEWDESDVSAFGFKKELEALGDIQNLNVHINSYGGETFIGLAIYNLLKQHKANINVYIDGIAASAASIIAMAGDKIYMPKTALIMIHNCWQWTVGNAKELRKTAEDMDKIATAYKAAYMSKVNITEEKLEKLLDEESYLTADECIEMGFADEIVDLHANSAINQNSTMCLYNLVQKAKQHKKTESEKMKIDEESINQIVEKIKDKITKDAINEDEKDSKKESNVDKDTLIVSIFNNFLNKKGEI